MNKNLVIGLVIVAAILAVIPFVAPNNFYLDLAIRMAINAIIALGLNLLIGFAGQISLGHAGFLGIGAYASAVLPTHFGWHPLLAMGAGYISSAYKDAIPFVLILLILFFMPRGLFGGKSTDRV